MSSSTSQPLGQQANKDASTKRVLVTLPLFLVHFPALELLDDHAFASWDFPLCRGMFCDKALRSFRVSISSTALPGGPQHR